MVLGTEVVALLQWDSSGSLGSGVLVDRVGSFDVSLPAKRRARRLKVQQERFRLCGRTTCDWRPAMAPPSQKRLDNFKSGLGEAHVCLSTWMGISKLLTKGDKAKAKSQIQTDSVGVVWPSFLCGKA